jgi:hypothetical protein
VKVPFVKGHCGWDTVTLIPAGTIPPSRELDAALRILAAPMQGGLEVGYLARGERPDELRLRIADSTARDWISMCGGMTQVIGKALIESTFRERFGIDVAQSKRTIRLITDSSVVPIEIESDGDRMTLTTTVMDGYAAFLYSLGVRPVTLRGVEGFDVGDFVVFDIVELEKRHPTLDFTRRDPGPHLEIVNDLLREYQRYRRATTGVLGMLYDARPEGPGKFRVFPRFLGEGMAAASIPYEFQCGTGTVAVGIALVAQGLAESGEVLLEWGSAKSTPDPYGIRTSRLTLGVQGGRVTAASFSHSVVEILADGTLFLPET